MARSGISVVLAAIAWAISASSVLAAGVWSLALGDTAVDGSFIKPYSNVWLFTSHSLAGETKIQGLWTDQVQVVNRDGRELLQRVQGTIYSNGVTTSVVNLFDPKTMAPVESELHGRDGKLLKRTFSGKHIVALNTAKTSATEERSETDLANAPFDFSGGMYGLLLAALPLRAGEDIRLPDIDEFESKAQGVDVHVEKQDWVQAGRSGRIKAWVVTNVLPDSKMTFWLSKEPPYVIRLNIHSSKGDLRWDML